MTKKSTLKVHMNKNVGTFLTLLLIFAIGVGLCIWGLTDINKINYFKEHGVDVVGKVVDYDRSTDEDDDDIYYAIYEYYVDGNNYTVKASDYTYSKPSMGAKHVVYYNPENPSEAMTDLKGGLGPVLLVVGLIFGMTGLAFILAWFNVKESIIQILLGAMMVLIGFGLPFVVGSWLMFFFTAIFGVLGIVIVVKAITKMTGNEGGIVDQIIDEGMEQVGEVLQDAIEATDAEVEAGTSPLLYVPNIVKGVIVIISGGVFTLFGVFMLLVGSFIGIIFAGVGVAVIFLGVKSIKQGLDIRKEAKQLENTRPL